MNDYLTYFDQTAFLDNPDWSACYCLFYHDTAGDAEWSGRTREQNRNRIIELILERKHSGYLAYQNGKVVGWCHANAKPNLGRLLARTELNEANEPKIGSIVCFNVSPFLRKKGIARALLDAACAGFKKKGFQVAEAYPRKGKLTNAECYHGPLSIYEAAGFTVHKDLDNCLIMRKTLE
jgi:ribosomal protein S18 acetylase RimI-like enzyme